MLVSAICICLSISFATAVNTRRHGANREISNGAVVDYDLYKRSYPFMSRLIMDSSLPTDSTNFQLTKNTERRIRKRTAIGGGAVIVAATATGLVVCKPPFCKTERGQCCSLILLEGSLKCP